MISWEKLMILAPLLKLPKNVGDLGKFIVAKGFKKLPKVQKIANSGHTASHWLSKFKLCMKFILYMYKILYFKFIRVGNNYSFCLVNVLPVSCFISWVVKILKRETRSK